MFLLISKYIVKFFITFLNRFIIEIVGVALLHICAQCGGQP